MADSTLPSQWKMDSTEGMSVAQAASCSSTRVRPVCAASSGVAQVVMTRRMGGRVWGVSDIVRFLDKCTGAALESPQNVQLAGCAPDLEL